MRRAVVAAVVLAMGMIVGAKEAPAGAVFDDKAIDQAIEKGKEWLWNARKPDGKWGTYKTKDIDYEIGPTALAVYALLEAGADPKDPRIVQSLEWMQKKMADKIKKCEAGDKNTGLYTYEVGLVCNAYHAANRGTEGKYLKDLEAAASMVWKYNHKGGLRYEIFKYDPNKEPTDSDNSNAQYSLLGVWAAAMDNVEVPREYWQKAYDHWAGCQCKSGGWGYEGDKGDGYGRMTAGGVASLFVCYDNLFYNEIIDGGKPQPIPSPAPTKNQKGKKPAPPPQPQPQDTAEERMEKAYAPIKRGLDWFDKNFEASLPAGGGWGPQNYYLYGVERVGLACGYKYFGTSDWYKLGAKQLLSSQGDAGNWGDTVNTSFAVLFLSWGRNPILFNKLDHDADWNNRPRDLAMLTRWLTSTGEKPVNWQIINRKVPVSEWHDAPMVYLAGAKDPKFSDDDVQKLRTFVQQGGTIFAVTEKAGVAFSGGIKTLCSKTFPNYAFGPVPDNHELYTCFDKLTPSPRFNVLSNGVRPLLIHVEFDLAKAWQSRAWSTEKRSFMVGRNVSMYVTDWRTGLRPRGTTLWPDPSEEPATPSAVSSGPNGDTVKIVRLDHNANSNPEPMAYDRFKLLMNNLCHVKVDVEGPIAIAKLPESAAKVAVMTGTGTLKLSPEEQDAIRKFVSGGGMVIIDAAGGSKDFAKSVQDILAEMYGADSLNRLASSSGIYQLKGMEIDKVKYRRRTRGRMGKEANLRVVAINDRPGIIFSAEDLTAGMLGVSGYGIDGYDCGDASSDPGTAFKLMRNLVLFGASSVSKGP